MKITESIWKQRNSMPSFPPLQAGRCVDVLIIGGGMAGLLCAWQLQQSGIDCLLLEADTLCGGTTQNTTAKLTVQHGLIYAKLVRTYGTEQAARYLQANQRALDAYRALCKGIRCSWEEKDNYIYSRDDPRKLEQELNVLQALHAPADYVQQLSLPFDTVGAVRFSHQAQFDPLAFAAAIAPSLSICEHTPVRELAPHQAKTDHGTIRAENIIVATHFPFLNKHGAYFLKLYQDRSYVLALQNAPEANGMYMDACGQGYSFRSAYGQLLLGGGAHRTGSKGGGWESLEQAAKQWYPQATVTHRWAAQDCMSLDGLPYIGRYARRTKGLYVATGFNKWGMTGSMVAAQLLTDELCGKENEAKALLDPGRSIWQPQLAVNAAESVKNLLTPTAPRCPHLGCALKWNAAEHSWDCPCHGSRFDRRGHLIEGPATGGCHVD